ncbi:MAG: cyclodeaminase/cyclohydrolase family protein [Candidatus Brocadiia bacterium]
MDITSQSLRDFVTSLSSVAPTPGGGSGAAASSAMGAALVAMAARITASGKKFADRKERMEELAGKLDESRKILVELIDRDAAAYEAVSLAMKLPRNTEEEKAARKAALQVALKHAAEVPLQTMQVSLDVLRIAPEVVQNSNPNCVTDAVSGGLLAETGLNCALLNVLINLDFIDDKDFGKEIGDKSSDYRKEACVMANRVKCLYNLSREGNSL